MIFADFTYNLSRSSLSTAATVVTTAKIIYNEINKHVVHMVIVDLTSVMASTVCHYLYPFLNIIATPVIIIINSWFSCDVNGSHVGVQNSSEKSFLLLCKS